MDYSIATKKQRTSPSPSPQSYLERALGVMLRVFLMFPTFLFNYGKFGSVQHVRTRLKSGVLIVEAVGHGDEASGEFPIWIRMELNVWEDTEHKYSASDSTVATMWRDQKTGVIQRRSCRVRISPRSCRLKIHDVDRQAWTAASVCDERKHKDDGLALHLRSDSKVRLSPSSNRDLRKASPLAAPMFKIVAQNVVCALPFELQFVKYVKHKELTTSIIRNRALDLQSICFAFKSDSEDSGGCEMCLRVRGQTVPWIIPFTLEAVPGSEVIQSVSKEVAAECLCSFALFCTGDGVSATKPIANSMEFSTESLLLASLSSPDEEEEEEKKDDDDNRSLESNNVLSLLEEDFSHMILPATPPCSPIPPSEEEEEKEKEDIVIRESVLCKKRVRDEFMVSES